ncbi:MAG: hypothetical protein V1492_01215 [Candidatus Micrarchaeota archaeon]
MESENDLINRLRSNDSYQQAAAAQDIRFIAMGGTVLNNVIVLKLEEIVMNYETHVFAKANGAEALAYHYFNRGVPEEVENLLNNKDPFVREGAIHAVRTHFDKGFDISYVVVTLCSRLRDLRKENRANIAKIVNDFVDGCEDQPLLDRIQDVVDEIDAGNLEAKFTAIEISERRAHLRIEKGVTDPRAEPRLAAPAKPSVRPAASGVKSIVRPTIKPPEKNEDQTGSRTWQAVKKIFSG